MPTNAEYEARIGAMEWADLQTLWRAIERRDTPEWEPGKAFEYLVLRAFQLDGALVRWPFLVPLFGEDIEEVDGAVYCAGLSCLVESKDLTENVAVGPIAKLRNQLLRRPAATVGMMFSRTAFTEPARFLAHFALPQAILLWRGSEIEFALERRELCELVAVKYRICVEEGLPDYNVREGDLA